METIDVGMKTMELKVVFALLVLLSTSFAWTTGYEPPSCLTQYSVLGVNFTATTVGQSIPCTTNTGHLYGTIKGAGPHNTYFTITSSYNITFGTSSLGTGGQTNYLELTNLPFPTNGTYYVNNSGNGGGYGATAQIGCWNGTTATKSISTTGTGAFSANGNITSNGANITIKIGTTQINCSNGETVFFYTSGICAAPGIGATWSFPAWSSTTATELNAETLLAYQPLTTSNGIEYLSYTSNGIIRSDFKKGLKFLSTADASQYCKVFIYYGSTLLLPQITYIPSVDAFGYFYNASDSVAYLQNNSANYVLDAASGLWYSVLPFVCSDYNTIYAQSAYLYPYASSNNVFPPMYVVQNCYVDSSGNYTWTIKGTSSALFNFTKYYLNSSNDSVLDSSTFTGITYTGTTNLTDAVNLSISSAGYNVCSWQNGTNILFSAPSFIAGDALTKVIGAFIMIVMLGITVVFPFAGVGVLFMNDIFSYFTQVQAFGLAVSAVGLSFLVNSVSEKSIKNVGFYVAIGLAVFVYYSSTAGPEVQQSCIPVFMNANGVLLKDSLTSMSTALTTANLGQFIVAAPSLLLSLFGLVIDLTSYIWAGIYSPIKCINYNLGNAVEGMGLVISLGVAMWVIVKAYEVISNRFRNI
jgi:hypothetical protein